MKGRKKVRFYVMRDFKCPVCGYTHSASKKCSAMTGMGHIKTMYCPFCKEERDFIQIGQTVIH